VSVNVEFLARLDREIESLNTRISGRRANDPPEDEDILRLLEDRLTHLRQMRKLIVEQSRGE
jgi:hypothetical protein